MILPVLSHAQETPVFSLEAAFGQELSGFEDELRRNLKNSLNGGYYQSYEAGQFYGFGVRFRPNPQSEVRLFGKQVKDYFVDVYHNIAPNPDEFYYLNHKQKYEVWRMQAAYQRIYRGALPFPRQYMELSAGAGVEVSQLSVRGSIGGDLYQDFFSENLTGNAFQQQDLLPGLMVQAGLRYFPRPFVSAEVRFSGVGYRAYSLSGLSLPLPTVSEPFELPASSLNFSRLDLQVILAFHLR